jgi:hypothetical protein
MRWIVYPALAGREGWLDDAPRRTYIRAGVGARVAVSAAYGATQPIMGTELIAFFGLPSITRSLYET